MKYQLLILFSCIFLIAACQQSAEENQSTTSQQEKDTEEEKEKKEITFNLPNDFILEDLYNPNDSLNDMGSWVALAEGPNKIMYTCDQYGDIYKFPLPAKGDTLVAAQIDSVDLEIGHAHGLLWAFNSLYVAVNKGWDEEVPDEEEHGSGVYRVTDTNGDGELDKVEMLLKLEGAGEHGPHNFAVGPTGKDLYFLAGNHVLIPEEIKKNSRLPNNWGEDNVFPPYLDARGHANEIEAPGGWIARTDPDGKNWELISSGYRNPFDLAFNEDGELFTYDADMEWDIGMPWYRPTRVCHVTSGSEFGWRTGSGKWPDYYPDNLPAVVNLEQGCPTGILMGSELNVPARYKNGLFIMDWSFGTIYFVDLQTKGSSYTATKEEFLSGTPLPLTDMIAGSDGNLYFATGGRRLESHLYRLSFSGTDEGQPHLIKDDSTKELRQLRQEIEQYHYQQSPKAIPLAWQHLNHPDRFIQYAARIALEHQPTRQWSNKFEPETDTEKIIQAGIALARTDNAAFTTTLVEKLSTLKWAGLSTQQRLNLIRGYNLIGIRSEIPTGANRTAILDQLANHFPSTNNAINRELSQLLLSLNAEGSTAQLVGLLTKHTENRTTDTGGFLATDVTERSEQYGPLIREVVEKMPPSEAIFYSLLLSHAKEGWTDDLRAQYFQWFYDVMSAKGGLSFKPFMENVRRKAMKNVPDHQKQNYEELSGVFSPLEALENLPEPIGPGKEYSAREINNHIWKSFSEDYKRTIADGKRAFDAAMCSACHRMKGEGSNIGPDLSQAHDKFGSYDLTFAIYSPNDEISDQYAFTLFEKKDGQKIAGKVISEKGEVITIAPNPYMTSYTVEIPKADIVKRDISPISPMPPGLLNRLNKDEIEDLYRYLLSGGDENHKFYTGEEE